MEKISAMQLQQELIGKMHNQQQIATNPFSNQTVVSAAVKGIINDNTQVNPASESALQFSHAFKGILDTVDKYQAHASDKITAVELGKSDDLLGATVASQKAQLSFNALMQVRNKMVSNFQDIIKMPI
ncbi:flagellar hook-basal body complex protein FliE [Vibrio mediterranei]|uniref:flagellar hook-basal body complex protein FliE n=1 Tax=Vibrio mediterranei TaxID=689 RepID=UPI00148E19E3|nr:flagellar hook-basal body complex protein FliE [Vibrio mediterranei]NOH30369.1 flagellar hook-basal body complex protein FliE [Vibrio mediterranei]